MDRSKAIILAHQEFGNEKGAEQKKDRNAKISKQTEVIELEVLTWLDRQMIHAMHNKDAEKREEAQDVQLRAIVTTDLCFVH